MFDASPSFSISFKDDANGKDGICGSNSYNLSVANPTTFATNITEITVAATATTATTAATGNSALGESLSSKRCSLDRHNELSAGIDDDDDDGDDDNDNDNNAGSKDASNDADDTGSSAGAMTDGNGNGNGRGKKGRRGGRSGISLLPNINFTRRLFFRNKQQQRHINSWRLFGDKQWKSNGEATAATSNSTVDGLCCSTTGLILEDRPSTLPAKSLAEQRRHEEQYLALIEATKRKEAWRARQRQQLLELERKKEDETVAAAQVWSTQILPHWEQMKESKYCRDLWWRGIPSKVRGRVWSLAIGNELNITPELYEICVVRARHYISTSRKYNHFTDSATIDATNISTSSDDHPSISTALAKGESGQLGHEGTLELIHLDVSRTFPHLGFFQKGGPYENLLLDLLGAYVCYRPDIGYVQSMCFLGAMLLLQIHQPYQSFQAFANLINRPLLLAFFGLRQSQMTVYFIAYDLYFEQELPKLHNHFDVLDVRPDLYLIEWLYTLYAKSLPFDVCCRVWDVFLRDGEQFLFDTALGILHLYESELETMGDFDAVVNFLTHLPQSMNVSQLFGAIEPFMKSFTSSNLISENGNGKRQSFQQICADVNERIAQAAVMTDNGGCSSLVSSSMKTAPQRSLKNQTRKVGELPISPSTCVASNGSARNGQQEQKEQQSATTFCSSVRNIKMSKSMSEFLDDLLRGASTQTNDVHADVISKKCRTPATV